MLYDLIIYTPMFTALFWSIVLLTTRGREGRAKMIFGIFMFVSFLLYLSHAVYFQEVERAYLFIDPIYTFATLSVYPLYYWYIRQLTVDRAINFNHLNLLIPATLLSGLTAIFYALMDSGERSHYIHQFIFGNGVIDLPSTLIWAQVYTYIVARFTFVIIIFYVFFKGRPSVKKYNQRIANHFSNLSKKTIHWVNKMLYLFIATSILSITLNFLGRSFFLDSPYLLAIPSVIFTSLYFSIGFLAYHQKYDISNVNMPAVETSNTNDIEPKGNNKLLKSLIIEFEENKVYRQQELKITELAALMNTNRTYISNLINQEFKCSFNEYVNRFRIEEAKQLIVANNEEPMEQIAIKVGYGSLSTFFRTFKIQEGMTPSHFKKIKQKKVA